MTVLDRIDALINHAECRNRPHLCIILTKTAASAMLPNLMAHAMLRDAALKLPGPETYETRHVLLTYKGVAVFVDEDDYAPHDVRISSASQFWGAYIEEDGAIRPTF